MANSGNSGKPSTDDKILEQFETSLRRLAMDGELDLPITDELLHHHREGLSPEAQQRMWKRISERRVVADRLRAGRGRPGEAKLPFPELLRTLRTSAGITIDEAARALRLESGDVSALEAGRRDLLKVPATLLATLMEIYSLPLSLVTHSLKRFLTAQKVRGEFSGVSARSASDVSENEYEEALRDLASHLVEERNTIDDVTLPDGYVEKLKATLRKRGRSDLL